MRKLIIVSIVLFFNLGYSATIKNEDTFFPVGKGKTWNYLGTKIVDVTRSKKILDKFEYLLAGVKSRHPQNLFLTEVSLCRDVIFQRKIIKYENKEWIVNCKVLVMRASIFYSVNNIEPKSIDITKSFKEKLPEIFLDLIQQKHFFYRTYVWQEKIRFRNGAYELIVKIKDIKALEKVTKVYPWQGLFSEDKLRLFKKKSQLRLVFDPRKIMLEKDIEDYKFIGKNTFNRFFGIKEGKGYRSYDSKEHYGSRHRDSIIFKKNVGICALWLPSIRFKLIQYIP